MVALGRRRVLTFKGHERIFWSDENVPNLDRHGSNTGMHFTKTHSIIQLNVWTLFM